MSYDDIVAGLYGKELMFRSNRLEKSVKCLGWYVGQVVLAEKGKVLNLSSRLF